jgi:hypothetical protein
LRVQAKFLLELIRLAAREEPDDWRMQFMLGRDLLVLGDPREAADQLEAVVNRTWDNIPGESKADALKCLVSAHQKLGDLNAAANYADQMICANPTNAMGNADLLVSEYKKKSRTSSPIMEAWLGELSETVTAAL